jgi:hypothetical protein
MQSLRLYNRQRIRCKNNNFFIYIILCVPLDDGQLGPKHVAVEVHVGVVGSGGDV